MFNQFEPNVKATIAFLKLLKIKINNATVNETLQNHPNWPSLLCISDSLNKWNIPNGAGKIDPDQIEELPTPFIAYTKNREHPITIVTQKGDTFIQTYSNNYSKATVAHKEDFLKNWTGIYLIAEPTERSGEKEYEKNRRNILISSLIPVSLFILITALTFLFLFTTINKNFDILTVNAT